MCIRVCTCERVYCVTCDEDDDDEDDEVVEIESHRATFKGNHGRSRRTKRGSSTGPDVYRKKSLSFSSRIVSVRTFAKVRFTSEFSARTRRRRRRRRGLSRLVVESLVSRTFASKLEIVPALNPKIRYALDERSERCSFPRSSCIAGMRRCDAGIANSRNETRIFEETSQSRDHG